MTWIQILALPLASPVTLDKLLNLSKCHLMQWQMGLIG